MDLSISGSVCIVLCVSFNIMEGYVRGAIFLFFLSFFFFSFSFSNFSQSGIDLPFKQYANHVSRSRPGGLPSFWWHHRYPWTCSWSLWKCCPWGDPWYKGGIPGHQECTSGEALEPQCPRLSVSYHRCQMGKALTSSLW